MKKMLVRALGLVLFIGCNSENATESKTEAAVAPTGTEAKMQPAEFADAKYADIGKQGLTALSSGDIDGWMKALLTTLFMYGIMETALQEKKPLQFTGKKEGQN